MVMVEDGIEIARDAPVPTWFGVGGRADAMAAPASAREVAACARRQGPLRVLGDGANLLVEDAGVDGLVIDLRRLDSVEIDGERGIVCAGAGARLPLLITRTVRAGLGGLEVLAGIPASVGGAVYMNAGGRFGSIADSVLAVEAVREGSGERVRLGRDSIGFGYRQSGLNGLIVVAVEFELEQREPAELRAELKECMAYKKASQPMGARSAGCCFKNPVLERGVEGLGAAGERVSAGLVLDLAGCKGMREGGAEVSRVHANFLTAKKGSSASELIVLMERASERVRERFGVLLEREVVVWERGR